MTENFIFYMVCDEPNDDCVLGYCGHCPQSSAIDTLINVLEEESYAFYQWSTIKVGKSKITKLEKIVESKEDFEDRFRAQVIKIIRHHFITKQQKEFTTSMRVEQIKDRVLAVIQCDFGQNYSCVIQNAIQSYHWSPKQVTIHPFCAHDWDSKEGVPIYKTYFIISSTLKHTATTFHIFRNKMMTLFKKDFPHVSQLYSIRWYWFSI
jgi:hypothetical protein